MQDEIKWITKNGVHIPITNEYMNNKIRNNKQTSKATDEKAYQLTDEQLQQVIDESISKWDEDYAQLYMTKMNPQDFLNLTTTPQVIDWIESNKRDLDVNDLNKAKYVADMMYLDIDLQTGEINGHEGRHRMYALRDAGYKNIDVVVWARNYDKYHTKEYTDFTIKGQTSMELTHKSAILKKLVPVSKRNIDRIKERDY